MRELNREHRGIPKTTDVLSFPLFEGDEPLPSFPGQPRLLGDVVLCLERIDRQARERSWDFEDELIFCLVHGVLHLLGYDHETNDEDARKMYARQAELFATLRPDTPYENYIQL